MIVMTTIIMMMMMMMMIPGEFMAYVSIAKYIPGETIKMFYFKRRISYRIRLT
jgi:hypothetical protein